MIAIWHKTKPYLLPLAQWVVLILCTISLWQQFQNGRIEWNLVLSSLSDLPLLIVPFMLLVSAASWGIESRKWQYLIRDVKEIRFRESVIQNLTAQAASFITPARAGEYLIKTLQFPEIMRKDVLTRVFVGNSSQMLVTTVLGLLGLLLYRIDLEQISLLVWILGLIGATVMVVALYLSHRYKLKIVPNKLWWRTICYAMLRYIIFASNWVLILMLLVSDMGVTEIMAGTSVYYLVISVLPLIQLLDAPVKISVASYVFLGSGYGNEAILIATGLVWITNTLFPTVVGCSFLLGARTRQSSI